MRAVSTSSPREPASGARHGRRRSLLRTFVASGATAVLAAAVVASVGPSAVLGPAQTVSSSGAPHVMVVMMENESESELIGNPEAPNVNALARQYGSATRSYAIGHPSLPNYLELISGSNYGTTDDGTPSSEGISSGAQTLANQLQNAGYSWKAYMESMPGAGYTGGDSTCCGGQYYQHHNPFVYFPAVTSLSDFSSDMVPSTNMMSDLNSSNPPDFVWMTPNGTDDMHDGPTNSDGDVNPSVGDAWLGNFVSQVQSTNWYAQGGSIIIEWDEGADSDSSGIGHAGEGGGGHVVTLVVSAALRADPQQDSTPVNTAGVLRSIEGLYGLPYLADAANASNGNINSLLGAAPTRSITNAASAPAVAGETFVFSITTVGSPTPRLQKRGKLPKGLRFHNNHNGTATISGTPNPHKALGTHVVTIVATYGKGKTKQVVTQTFTLTVS